MGDLLDLSALGPLILLSDTVFGFEQGKILFSVLTRPTGATTQAVDLTLRIDRNGDGIADMGTVLQNFTGAREQTALGSGVLRVVPPITALGTEAAETLTGGAAAYTLQGAGGSDTLHGLGGNDDLSGGEGNDLLLGGAGNDALAGGAGNDRLVVSAGDALIRVTAEDIGGADTVIGFGAGERVELSAFATLAWAGVELPPSDSRMAPFSFGASAESGGLMIRVNPDGNNFSNFTLFLSGFTGTLAESAPGSRILAVV